MAARKLSSTASAWHLEFHAGFAVKPGCGSEVDLVHRNIATLLVEHRERLRGQQVIANLLVGAAVLEYKGDRRLRGSRNRGSRLTCRRGRAGVGPGRGVRLIGRRLFVGSRTVLGIL